jgi:hypothetical protein
MSDQHKPRKPSVPPAAGGAGMKAMENHAMANMAMASAAEVEALADHLSQLADAMHSRIMRAIRKQGPAGAGGDSVDDGTDDSSPAPGKTVLVLSRTEAQSLFDVEVALRQQANSLYMDAAHHAMAGLQASGESLDALAGAAKAKIARIDNLRELIEIGTDALALAGAAVIGKPEGIIAAFRKMKEHIGDYRDDKA